VSGKVTADSVPKRDFSVRRRKYEGRCWLIVRTSFYEIDDMVEDVWLACNGDASVGAIARDVAAHRGVSQAEADAMTRNAVKLLVDLRLIQLR
jgi:hypothetical protein